MSVVPDPTVSDVPTSSGHLVVVWLVVVGVAFVAAVLTAWLWPRRPRLGPTPEEGADELREGDGA